MRSTLHAAMVEFTISEEVRYDTMSNAHVLWLVALASSSYVFFNVLGYRERIFLEAAKSVPR